MKAILLSSVVLLASACASDHHCDPNAPNTICTIAGSTLNEGYSGDGHPATDAVLYIPIDSTIAPDGDVWFIDFNNYVVRSIDPKGVIHTVEGNGLLGDSPASDGLSQVAALQAYNNHTTGMFFADGYLYLAAWHESRVKRVDLNTMMMENFAGRGVRTYYDGDGGPAISAAFDLPSSIAMDSHGNIAVMDQGNQVVRQVDTSGNIHTLVGSCLIGTAGPCAAGQRLAACPAPSEKAMCGAIETERSYSGIDAMTTEADCTNACSPDFAGDGGPASQARLALPYGQAADPAGRIAYDPANNLYISDTGNNRIRRVDGATGIITTIAGNGSAGYAGDGGAATEAELNHPVDLALAPDGTIYFTDTYNSCVRKIDPTGVISTVVGQCDPDVQNATFSGDGGPPQDAHLNRPYGIDLEGSKLYVSDSYNNRLRVVNLPE